MKTTIRITTCVGIALLSIGLNAPPTGAQEEGFSPQNRLVDTSIYFAAGAREEEQTLRGALGWPTFQEGRVLGINYRFDPDGYARFGPTPTLDSDFFEVLCHPATRLCTATKQPIQLWMQDRETPRLTIRGIARNTRVYASDGTSRIELPADLLAELTPSVEQALLNASELVLETEGEAPQKISLAGFIPALVYIQWVAKGQDPSIFPAGWPVAQTGPSDDKQKLSLAPKTPDAAAEPTGGETALDLQPPARVRSAPAPLLWHSWRREKTSGSSAATSRDVANTDRLEGLLKICETLAPAGAARIAPAAQPEPDGAAGKAETAAKGGAAGERSIRELQWAVLKLSIMISAMERQLQKTATNGRREEEDGTKVTQDAPEVFREQVQEPAVTRSVTDDRLRLLLGALSEIRLPPSASSAGDGAVTRSGDKGGKTDIGKGRDTGQGPDSAGASAVPAGALVTDRTSQEAGSVEERSRKVIIEIRLTGFPGRDGREGDPPVSARGTDGISALLPSRSDADAVNNDFFPLEPVGR